MTGINGNYGKDLRNNIFYQNKGVKNETAKPEVKETIDVTGAKYEDKKIDLNKAPEGFYGAMGLHLSNAGIDKQLAAALDPKTLKYVQNTAPEVQARIAGNVNATYNALAELDEF